MNWEAAVRTLGGAPKPTDLTTRYAEPHRRYHTIEHATQVVIDAVNLTEGRDQGLVAVAGWAHDVVYDGKPGDDERASAVWVRERLREAELVAEDITRIEGLVLATITHTSNGDPVADALLDADLATLGAAPSGYERYRTAVRAEYKHVTDDDWRVGRAAVLRSLLNRDRLYRTTTAHNQWEKQARTNITNELATL